MVLVLSWLVGLLIIGLYVLWFVSRYRRDKRHYSQVLDSSSRALVERVCARELAAFGYPWEGASR